MSLLTVTISRVVPDWLSPRNYDLSYLGSLGSFGLAAGLSPTNEPSTGAWETESAAIERALEGGRLRADPRRRQEGFLR